MKRYEKPSAQSFDFDYSDIITSSSITHDMLGVGDVGDGVILTWGQE